MWMLWGMNCLARPTRTCCAMSGPWWQRSTKRTPPGTPSTSPEAIESWNPNRSVSQPPALQPQAASRIHTTDPSAQARIRYALRRARSMIAPDMIDAVVHEKSRNARKKTRLMLLVRFGPNVSDHGIPPWHAREVKSLEFGPIGRPGWLQL